MFKKTFVILALVIMVSILNNKSSFVYCQVVYIPLENGVYDFLERENLKGLIELNDEVKPFTRIYAAKKLIEIADAIVNRLENEKEAEFSDVENDELDFYLREYYYEVKSLGHETIKGQNSEKSEIMTDLSYTDEAISLNDKRIKERWFLFSYSDSLFNLKLSPIAGYSIAFSEKGNGHSRWIGLSSYSTYSNWFGASFDIRDKGEFGETVDKDKSFSEERGAWYKTAPVGIEYSDVKGSISFNWSWGNVSLIKDYVQWGHGEFGQLIMSDKAPSYPQLRLNLNPVSWLRFSYIHGWLNSLVLDSAAFYYTYPGTPNQLLRESYFSKYIAANLITVTPWDRIDISAGNAIVYSGDLRPEFFIPFMFYKFMDHNTGRGDVGDGNGMLFFDLSVKYPEKFKFYSTLFIDVTEIRNILENNFNNTWIGLTLGGKAVDLLFPNLDLTVEYTRINPWVYEHKDQLTNYKHLDFTLGHWLGQNADQIRIQADYQLIRGLKFMIFIERLRKGGLDDIYYAYNDIKNNGRSFLYSPLRTEYRAGLSVNYEYQHDLHIGMKYTYSDIKDEDDLRISQFNDLKNILEFSIYYQL